MKYEGRIMVPLTRDQQAFLETLAEVDEIAKAAVMRKALVALVAARTGRAS